MAHGFSRGGRNPDRSLTVAVLMFTRRRISTASVSESAHGQPVYLRLAIRYGIEAVTMSIRWNW